MNYHHELSVKFRHFQPGEDVDEYMEKWEFKEQSYMNKRIDLQ